MTNQNYGAELNNVCQSFNRYIMLEKIQTWISYRVKSLSLPKYRNKSCHLSKKGTTTITL